jgi:hypothetical protein
VEVSFVHGNESSVSTEDRGFLHQLRLSGPPEGLCSVEIFTKIRTF